MSICEDIDLVIDAARRHGVYAALILVTHEQWNEIRHTDSKGRIELFPTFKSAMQPRYCGIPIKSVDVLDRPMVCDPYAAMDYYDQSLRYTHHTVKPSTIR